MRHLIERMESVMEQDRGVAVVEANGKQPQIPDTKPLVAAAKALLDATQELDNLRKQMGGVRPMWKWEIDDPRVLRDYAKTDDGKKASRLFAAQAAVANVNDAFKEKFNDWVLSGH